MTDVLQQKVITFDRREADEVQEIISQRFAPARILPYEKSGRISLFGRYGRFPGIDFERSVVGAGFKVTPEQQFSSYFFLFPIEGEITFGSGSQILRATNSVAVCADGDNTDFVHAPTGLDKIAVTITKTLLRARLSTLLDRPITRDPGFEKFVDPLGGNIPSVTSLTHYLIDSWEAKTLQIMPFSARQASNLIADLILETWPHQFSEELRKPPSQIAPRHVRRAIAYISDQFEQSYTVDDLARLCGVSTRALQYGFKNFTGLSLTQYQRRVRLERARRLLTSEKSLTVNEIAILCGFSNTFRFCTHFKVEFGIHPAELRNQAER